MRIILLGAALALSAPVAAQTPEAQVAQGFRDWMTANNVPGLCWGVVKNGAVLMQGCEGVREIATSAPATADSNFRIASMSKAFTGWSILNLKASGKLGLEDLASAHVPEMKDWAGGITVGQLLHHSAGFVTDDPWGDRQQVLSDKEFTAMLKAGVPFQRAPGTGYEYSNFGYATLGRIISNASGQSYQRFVGEQVFTPLGMSSTTYDIATVPRDRLASGYRWENNRWSLEPELRDGAFGAMGGVITTANDYAKWMAHLLSAWPVAAGPVKDSAQSVLLEMRNGGGFTHGRARPGKDAPDCRLQMIYAAGLVAGNDCQLGPVVFHSGGYPGYGSHMLLLPEAGVGLFLFANRTYAPTTGPVWDAAGILMRAGIIANKTPPLSPALGSGYDAARRIWAARKVDGEKDILAMNFLLDRSAPNWAAELNRVKAQVGECDTSPAITPSGALSGHFSWTCTKGKLRGDVLLAPTPTPQIQAFRLSPN